MNYLNTVDVSYVELSIFFKKNKFKTNNKKNEIKRKFY